VKAAVDRRERLKNCLQSFQPEVDNTVNNIQTEATILNFKLVVLNGQMHKRAKRAFALSASFLRLQHDEPYSRFSFFRPKLP
jgi:hypothetical protein